MKSWTGPDLIGAACLRYDFSVHYNHMQFILRFSLCKAISHNNIAYRIGSLHRHEGHSQAESVHEADESVGGRVEDEVPRGGGGEDEGRVGEELEERLAERLKQLDRITALDD